MRQPLKMFTEFEHLTWTPLPSETDLLVQSLKEEGCRDPIRYWAMPNTPIEDCPIVDGHNRYRICNQHGIDYSVVGMEFQDAEAVKDWMAMNQLCRRNITDMQRSALRGFLYNRRVAERVDGEKLGAHSEPGVRVADAVATEAGTSRETIKRDGAVAKALQQLGEKAPLLRDEAMHDTFTKKDVRAIAEAPASVLLGIQQRPREEWKPAVQALAAKIRTADHAAKQEKRDNRPGSPIQMPDEPSVDVPEVNDMPTVVAPIVASVVAVEKNANALVRSLSVSRRDFVGVTPALEHFDLIRLRLIDVFDSIVCLKRLSPSTGDIPI